MVDAIDPDTDLLVRTIYGEGGNEPVDGQQAIAATAYNRAQTNFQNHGASLREQLMFPGAFQAWEVPELAKRMHALRADDPAYQSILANIQPVKNGQISLPYVNYLNRATTPPGSSALSTWAQNPGTKHGAHEFYGPSDMGQGYDPETAAAMGLEGNTAPTGGVSSYGDPEIDQAMGIGKNPDQSVVHAETGSPIGSAAQQETAHRYKATGDLTPDPKTGGSLFKGAPLYFQSDDVTPDKIPNGSYYVDPKGVLQFKGAKVSDPLGSVVQGGLDVAENVKNILPGTDESTALLALRANREQYDALHSGLFWNDAGRFTGQVVPTTLALGGAAGVGAKLAQVAPKLAPVLEFLGGGAGKSTLNAAGVKVGGNALLHGASVATEGALQGGTSNVLMNADSNESAADKFKTGALIGAVANPIVNKVGSSIVNAVAPKTTQFVNDLTQELDKFGLLKGNGAIRATQIRGIDGALPDGKLPITPAEKAADVDQQLINRGAFGYRDSAAAQPHRMMEAVGSTIGLTPEQMPNGFASTVKMPDGTTKNIMAYAQDNIGATINDVRSRQVISGKKDLTQVFTDLAQEVLNAKDNGASPDGIDRLRDVINNLKRVTRSSGKLTGAQLQTAVAEGGELAKLQNHSDPAIRRAGLAMRGIAEKAMAAGSTPEDAAALKTAQLQYKNYKTLEDLVKNNPDGQFKMSDLQGAVNSNFDYNPHYTKSPLQVLADIGQRVPGLDAGPMKGSQNNTWKHSALGATLAELGLYGLGAMNLGSGAVALGTGAAVGGLAGRKIANTVGGILSDNSFLRQQLLNNTGYVPSPLTKFMTNNLPVPAATAATQRLQPTTTMKKNNEFLKNPLQKQQ